MDFLNIPFSENEKFESDGGGWEEYAMLRLRLTEGLNLKEYEAKLYDERVTAAEKNSALRKEKDSEISELKSKVSELEERLSAAENEVVRLKNMINKNSSNSSKPPSMDEPWEGNRKRKTANEYNSRRLPKTTSIITPSQ